MTRANTPGVFRCSWGDILKALPTSLCRPCWNEQGKAAALYYTAGPEDQECAACKKGVPERDIVWIERNRS